MEDLPVELVRAIALYCGWEGYTALRAVCAWTRACLPWWVAMRLAATRTVPLRTLPWDHAWFNRYLPADCYVQGTWVLDGFHGVVFLLDHDKTGGLGESVCARGVLEGTLVLHNPWRGGMSFMEIFRGGRPLHERVARPQRQHERPNDLTQHPSEDGRGDHDEPL